MSKFNKNTQKISTTVKNHPKRTTNAAGGESFELSPKMKLYQMVCTSLVSEPKFYKSVVNTTDKYGNKKLGKKVASNTDFLIVETLKKVAQEDPEFIMALANYARNEMYLRSIPTMLLVEGANIPEFKAKPNQKSLIKAYTPHIVKRVDEITESLAYQLGKFGKPIPRSLGRGLANTFNNFDEYQFGKYNRDKSVKLKDALRIVHPRPSTAKQAKLYKDILNDTLSSPETWEVILSNWKARGFESKTDAWEHIVNKVWLDGDRVKNYMAILRNLRNLMQENVSDATMHKVIAAIKNPHAVKYSRQLPFRFFSAYREIEHMQGSGKWRNGMMHAVAVALDHSLSNLDQLPGTTFMSVDHSGSMSTPVSRKGSVSCKDLGDLMCAIAVKLCENSVTSAFGDSFQTFGVNPGNMVMNNHGSISQVNVGHSTHGYLALEHLLHTKTNVDRIMIFTDMELYNASGWGTGSKTIAQLLKEYKRKVNPNVYTYVFDLAGYGDSVFPEDEKNVVLLSGWSEKVLKFVKAYERDGKTVMDEIDKFRV